MISGIVVSSDRCPWCQRLKQRLSDDGITVEVIDIDEAKQRGLFNEEWRTVPQLTLNDVFIGGYESYLEQFHNKFMKRKGELDVDSGFFRFKV